MNKSFSIRFLTAAMFCLLFGIAQIFAQSQASTGSITGVVSDSTGAVLPNATVTLISQGTNQTQTVNTSDDGIYRFVLLQPGKYTVKTTAANFAEQTLEVEVQVGRTTDANFTLGAGNVSAEVQVTAEGVQSTTSNFDAVQNETAIQNLPINGRRFQDFVTLTPGAQVGLGGDTRGQISLSGQRGINSNINVDGVDFNQPFFGGIRGGERSNSAFTIPQESIREFQVVAAGYSAEFGRSSGGIVNAVTKSGTNDLRGSLFYLLRPRQLARPNEYADALREQRLDTIIINGQQGVDATLAPTQHQFGGSIGGPIVKDRLFYFASYEQQRFRAPRQVLYPNLVGFTPSIPGQQAIFDFYRSEELPFTQSNDAYAGLGKIDWQINDDHRFNIRFNYSRNEALNGVSTGETSFDPTTTRALGTNGTEKNRNIGTVGQLISNFGPTLLNELRFQYAREDRPRIANELSPNVFTTIGEFGTRNFLPTTQFDTRYQVADSLTWISGNHTFKFGGEFSRINAEQVFGFGQTGEYSLTGQSTSNTLVYLSNARATTGFPNFLGRFDIPQAIYRQQIGNLQAAIKVDELAFFAQDSWRITPRLTFNYGLRAEQQFNPEPEATNTDLVNLVKNAQFPLRGGRGFDPTQIPDSGWQFGPRVGFAYDPAGDGKTVVRGFAGIYYARTPLLLLADSINNYRLPPGNVRAQLGSGFSFNQTAFNTFLGTPAGQPYRDITGCNPTGTTQQQSFCVPNTIYRQFAVIGVNLNTFPINGLPTLTPAQVQQIATILNPSFNPNIISGIAVTGTHEDFKNPRSFQFGFGFERELAQNFIFGIDYSHVKTDFLQRNVDLNLPAPILLDPSIDPAQRPYFGIVRPSFVPSSVPLRSRPVSQLSNVQVRESSAKSLYRALTFRTRLVRKWGQLNAYYTLSKNLSDDDNERDSGGVLYTNPFNLSKEYYLARIDRRHQFVANPIFFLPYGFEVSSAIRLRSGTPVNVTVNSDLNGDTLNNDRPYLVPGYETFRNAYRNRNVYDVDLRVQKGFGFGENRRLVLSTEFFNVFNLSNIQIGTTATNTFCSGGAIQRCGLDGITNPNFLQVREQRVGNSLFDQIIVGNNPGSQVFQVQFGARFLF